MKKKPIVTAALAATVRGSVQSAKRILKQAKERLKIQRKAVKQAKQTLKLARKAAANLKPSLVKAFLSRSKQKRKTGAKGKFRAKAKGRKPPQKPKRKAASAPLAKPVATSKPRVASAPRGVGQVSTKRKSRKGPPTKAPMIRRQVKATATPRAALARQPKPSQRVGKRAARIEPGSPSTVSAQTTTPLREQPAEVLDQSPTPNSSSQS